MAEPVVPNNARYDCGMFGFSCLHLLILSILALLILAPKLPPLPPLRECLKVRRMRFSTSDLLAITTITAILLAVVVHVTRT